MVSSAVNWPISAHISEYIRWGEGFRLGNFSNFSRKKVQCATGARPLALQIAVLQSTPSFFLSCCNVSTPFIVVFAPLSSVMLSNKNVYFISQNSARDCRVCLILQVPSIVPHMGLENRLCLPSWNWCMHVYWRKQYRSTYHYVLFQVGCLRHSRGAHECWQRERTDYHMHTQPM